MMSAQLQQVSGAGEQMTLPESSGSPLHKSNTTNKDRPLENEVQHSQNPFEKLHADSLIAWQLFEQHTVDRAKRENKPILLSIGFLASHYCRQTRLESWSNPKLASLVNDNFIPIIVDRHERPDIDRIYMSYNQSSTSSAGWPLNVFLTPDLVPILSGTYWAAPGNPSPEADDDALTWITVVEKVLENWTGDKVREEAKNTVDQLRQFSGEGTLSHAASGSSSLIAPLHTIDPSREIDCDLDLDHIEQAYTRISNTFDPMFGGFGDKEKFYTPAKLSFMLRACNFPQVVQDVVGPEECLSVRSMALHTLHRTVLGAVHDHIGGGFHRHSITRDWSLPAFEKMLADNALLLGLFLDAWLSIYDVWPAHEPVETVTELADYLTNERILNESGGFFNCVSASSPNRRGNEVMRNGSFYLWTRKEFDAAIGDEQEAGIAAAYWNVQEHGNIDREHDPHDEFLNQNVLQVVVEDPGSFGARIGTSPEEVKRCIGSAKQKLHSYSLRERVQPEVERQIVTAYNGMAIAALSRTAAMFLVMEEGTQEKGSRYLTAAKNAALFVKTKLWEDGEKVLYRSYAGSSPSVRASAEDYAFLIEGLIDLYETTSEESWLEWADELQNAQIKRHYDHPSETPTGSNARCGGFYSSDRDASLHILRIKDAIDTAQPSSNAVSVSNLFRLGSLLGDETYTYLAKETLAAFESEMLEYPQLFPGLLCGLVPWKIGGARHVALSGDFSDPKVREYFTAPRAGLSTLRWHNPKTAKDSWIGKRDPNFCPPENGA